jgi:hypothetical protein
MNVTREYMEVVSREAQAYRAIIEHGLQYSPPIPANSNHRIADRYGKFLAEAGTAVEAVERAAENLNAKI